MNIQKFIKDLKRGAGAANALKIAERAMKNTAPDNRMNLPKGPIFFKEDRRQTFGYTEKELRDLHNWWTNVYHVMKKELK